MTDTKKPRPDSEDQEQPKKRTEQRSDSVAKPSSEESSDRLSHVLDDRNFLTTFKNLLNRVDGDSQSGDGDGERKYVRENEGDASSRDRAAGQIEERVLGAGQVKQIIDRVTGTVSTKIATGAIEEIVHSPGMPPQVKMRDPEVPVDSKLKSGDAIALAEASGQGKSVTIFSDGRVEIKRTGDSNGLPKDPEIPSLTIEYPPHHSSGLKEEREFVGRHDGLIVVGIDAQTGDELRAYTDGRRERVFANDLERLVTVERAHSDSSGTNSFTITTQTYADGSTVTNDGLGLRFESSVGKRGGEPLGPGDEKGPSHEGFSGFKLVSQGREVPLPTTGQVIRIGREDGDVVVPKDNVSRDHCQIEVLGGNPHISDRGSTNGTYVLRNGNTIKVGRDPVQLQPGDVIRLGTKGDGDLTWLKAEKPAEKVAAKVEAAEKQKEVAAPAEKSWSSFKLKLSNIELDLPQNGQTIKIGRNETLSNVIVNLGSVSREHCHIEMRNDGPYLRDAGSLHGTFILRDGKALPVPPEGMKLLPQDQIRLGKGGAPVLNWEDTGKPAQQKPKPAERPKDEADKPKDKPNDAPKIVDESAKPTKLADYKLSLAGKEFKIEDNQKVFRIGRNPDTAHAVVSSSIVGRDHCVIEMQKDGPRLIDNSSVNGTYILRDGLEIQVKGDGETLKAGDVIRLGKDGAPQLNWEVKPPPVPEGQLPKPQPQERVSDRAKEGAHEWADYRLRMAGRPLVMPQDKDVVRLGRNPDAVDVVVPFDGVSREHCNIEMRKDGPYVVDKGSRNGTFILRDGLEIPVTADGVKLNAGDKVRLGMEGEALTWELSDRAEMVSQVERSQIIRKSAEIKEIFKDFKLNHAGEDLALPNAGDRIRIGRNPDKADVVIDNEHVSREHAEIDMRSDGPYVRDLASKHGTFIIRDEKAIQVPDSGMKLELGDRIRLGLSGLPELTWDKAGKSDARILPKGYRGDTVKPGATEKEREEADPASSYKARRASNEFLTTYEYDGRIPNGFQVVGGLNTIDENGKHPDRQRVSYVVDLRPGKDPALEKFIADAKNDLAHLKGQPEKLAEELAKRVKAALEPSGWSNRQVDEGYARLRSDFAGRRLVLGDFLAAAANGEGAGVCNHQSCLLKVAFDSFYPNERNRPKMKLQLGFCGDNPAGLAAVDAMNHAWTTLTTDGGEKIFDPRQRIYGEPVEARPSHQPGKLIPQLQGREIPPERERPDDAQEQSKEKLPSGKLDHSKIVGEEVGYGGSTWRVKEVADGKVLLVAAGARTETMEEFQKLNVDESGNPREPRVGETYKVTRSDGTVDDGWTLKGWKDPVKQDELLFVKADTVQRRVSLDQVREENPHLFRNLSEVSPVPPPKPPSNNPYDFGLVNGREINHRGRAWFVEEGETGFVNIARPAEREMGPEEFRRLNGETQPKVGQEVWYQRSTGEMQQWRVVGYDDATGNVRVRSEAAYRERIALNEVLDQNPELKHLRTPADTKSILENPKSRVVIHCKWTDGDSGHDKFIGHVEGPDGERIKVMIHKNEGARAGTWKRLKNDMAAQSVAQKMGAPDLFPPTVFRDGMMVQAFAGREGENLQTYLHGLSRKDTELRASERNLEKRIVRLMDRIDPQLRDQLARGVAYSLLLGDGDQHGANFVIDRTGPKPSDVRLMRVDTDYAFAKNSTPVMDQRFNYGDVVNGMFRYFSGKELPEQVRNEIRRVHDDLNPSDSKKRNEARDKFARETHLSREQVNALADRARFLTEGGTFPKTLLLPERDRDHKSVMGLNEARDRRERERDIRRTNVGDVLGTVASAAETIDISKVCDQLQQKGVDAAHVEAARKAFDNLAAERGNPYAESAMETLRKIADAASGIDKDRASAMIDLIQARAKDKELFLNFEQLASQDLARLNQAKDLINRTAQLTTNNAVPAETTQTIKNRALDVINQGNPERIQELARVTEKLSDPKFVSEFGAERLKALGKLVEIQKGNSHLQVPLEHFLDPQVKLENINFALERYREVVAGQFRQPAEFASGGDKFEFRSSVAAMEALKKPLADGTRLVFIPAVHGSQADSQGVDGIFFDPKTGKVTPVDWTTNMETKQGGKEHWATSPPETAVGRQGASGNPDKMRQFIETLVPQKGRATLQTEIPNVNSSAFVGPGKVPFPKLGHPPVSNTSVAPGLQGVNEYIRLYERNHKDHGGADFVAEKLYDRAKAARPHLHALAQLSNRLNRSIADSIENGARGNPPPVLDASSLKPLEDQGRPNPQATRDEMRKVLVALNTSIDQTNRAPANRNRRQTDLFDIQKLEGEWDRGEFGTESRRFWSEAKFRLNQDPVKPMKYVEVAFDQTVVSNPSPNMTSTIDRVRLYEDGTICGFRDYEERGRGKQSKLVELGHIGELAPAIKRGFEGVRDAGLKARMQRQADLLTQVSETNPLDLTNPNAVVKAFSESVAQGAPLRMAAQRARDLDDITSKLPGVSEAEAAQVYDRVGKDKLKPEELRRVLDTIKLEQEHKIPTAKAEEILAREVKLRASGETPATARDMAILQLLHQKTEAQAKDIALKMQSVRDGQPNLSYRDTASLAETEVALAKITGNALPQVQETLRQLIQDAKTGDNIDIGKVRDGLWKLAADKALDDKGTHTEEWFKLAATLEEREMEGFKKLLGIAPDATAGEVTARLKQLSDRFEYLSKTPQSVESPVVPFEQLKINKDLLNAERIGRFHERLAELLPDAASNSKTAGNKLRNAFVDFLAEEGVADPALTKERLELKFSADAKLPVSEHYIEDGGKNIKVVRRGDEFVREDGKSVDAAKVKTQITLPESVLKGNPAELARALYAEVAQHTGKGASTAGERAGLYAYVDRALERSRPAPTRPGTTAGDGGVDVTQLPPEQRKPVEVEFTDKGIKVSGTERELSFAEVWKGHVDKLKEELKSEEGKQGKDRNENTIKELRELVAREQALFDRLSNPSHPEHAKSLESAKQRMQGFAAHESDVEKLSREKGGGARGRLVAITILASAFIAHHQKAKAEERARTPVKEPMSGGTAGEGVRPRAGEPPIDKVEPKPGKPEALEKTEPRPEAKDPAEKVEAGKLSGLPNSELSKQSMLRLLPSVNQVIDAQNKRVQEELRAQGKPDSEFKAKETPRIDEKKLKAEWERNEFGPESRRLWQMSTSFLEQESLRMMQIMDARGMKFPPGAPAQPRMSDSGSGLRETDEMFRTRLRAGEVKVELGSNAIKPGELPTADQTVRLINTTAWVGKSAIEFRKAMLEGNAAYVEHGIKGVESLSKKGDLNGWKRPKDASAEDLERWSMAASAWVDTAARARSYAETIAALNAATTTRGMDFPGLSDIFKSVSLPDGATTFPDAALKPGNFPGEIKRDDQGNIVSMKFDLPDTLDRSAANLAKMEKLDKWMARYGPQVDQVLGEIQKSMINQNRMLMWLEDSGFDRSKTVPADDLRRANSGLKGNSDDIGKAVKLHDGEGDWRIKSINPNGSYELFKAAPNGEEFNLKRYGFTSEKCDKDGKPNPKGDYLKVHGYQDYQWARFYAYNNWNYAGSVQTVQRVPSTQEPMVVHKNDFLPIMDNGRMRLMQAKNIDTWANAQEVAKQTGNVAVLAVDVGMIVTGTIELKAAQVAARKGGEVAIRQLAKEYVKGIWHVGLGSTGFLKQAIENNVPYGQDLMKIRHMLIMADLTFQLTPATFQAGVSKAIWGEGKALSAVESTSRVDRALHAVHAAYGAEKVGLFALCDYYFLAQFTDTLVSLKPEDGQRQKLVEAMLKGPGGSQLDRPAYLTPDALAKSARGVLDDYGQKLSTSTAATERSAEIDKAVAEATKLAADSIERQKFVQHLLDMWHTTHDAQEKLACARGLMELLKDGQGKLPDSLGVAELNGRPVGISASAVSWYVDRSATTIGNRVAELAKVADDAPEKVAYRNQLIAQFKISVPEEEVAAAKGLQALQVDQAGKPTELDAASGVKLKDLERAIESSAPELLKKAGELLVVDHADPKRQEFIRLAQDVFKRMNSPEKDKAAAAIALLTLRTGDDPSQSLGKARGDATTARLLAYLKDRATTSQLPETKLAVGDFLFRTARSTEGALLSERQTLAQLEGDLAKDPENKKLKEQVDEAKKRVEKLGEFQKAIGYGMPDFTNLLMDVLKDDKVPRHLKLEAIASPHGPRLAALLEQLKYQVEPSLAVEPDDAKRMAGIAQIYGRDSAAIANLLRATAKDETEHPDVRALAVQALSATSGERHTVNGVPITPGSQINVGTGGGIKVSGEGIASEHAAIRVVDGVPMIRDLGSTEGTWIVRPNGTREKVSSNWTEIQAADRVVLGNKEKGTELLLAHERIEGLARLGAQVKLNGARAGGISEESQKELKETLTAPLPPRGAPQGEALVAKYRAATQALELGTPAGGDRQSERKMIAEALLDCVQSRHPEVAALALSTLTPDLLSSASHEKVDKLRDAVLANLGNSTDRTNPEFRAALVNALPALMTSGTIEQRNKAVRMLESLVMPGAADSFGKQDQSSNYPTSSSHPELRARALNLIADLNPDKAAELSRLALLGGDYLGAKVAPAPASVRLAAVVVLEKTEPLELQKITLQALRTEGDPTVLAKLWNVEFGSRRPDLDPVRLNEEYLKIRERIVARAHQGLFDDAKKKAEELGGYTMTGISRVRSEARGYVNYAGEKDRDPLHPEARRARLALLYMAQKGTMNDNLLAGDLALHLQFDPGRKNWKENAKDLSAPIEAALMSSPKMKAETKLALVQAYVALRPGDNGVVSKDEAAVVLTNVLTNELKSMERVRYANPREYENSLQLQAFIMKQLSQLPCEKVLPQISALSEGESIKAKEEKPPYRPLEVKYGDITRSFEYSDRGNQLVRFTEHPSGKVFEPDKENPGRWVTKQGDVLDGVYVGKQPYEGALKDTTWLAFDRFQVEGDYGDFCYKKDGKSYLIKPNGTTIEEELKADSRRVKMTYPDKSTRDFVFTPDGGKISVVVTSQPDGHKDTWKMSKSYGLGVQIESADGNSTIHSGTWKSINHGGFDPFQFDRGDYVYVKGGKLNYFDVHGAHYQVDSNGSVSTVKKGTLPSDSHPYREVRIWANQLRDQYANSTSLPTQAAEAELRYVNEQQKTNPQFEHKFGKNATASSLADEMGAALSSSEDAHKVSKSLIMGVLAKPIEGPNDPRLSVLKVAATKDGNDLVRLTAAQLLTQTTNQQDLHHGVFALADLSKNSANAGLRREAARQLSELKERGSKLIVERAILETPDNPRTQSSSQTNEIPVERDVKYQRAYEGIKRSLLEGRKDILDWNWQQWNNFAEKNNFNLLTSTGFWRAQDKAVSDMVKNRGSLTSLFMSRQEKADEADQARNTINPKVWQQFDQLIATAMSKGEQDPAGKAARDALAYLALGNADGFPHDFRAGASAKAIEAICNMAKSNSPGRGDLDWVVQALLTEKQALDPRHKLSLAEALDAISGEKSKMPRETAAGIATLALEQEVRFMPRPGQPDYDTSVAYQKKLLDVLEKHGNRELAPVLRVIGQEHRDTSIRDRAKQVHDTIEKRETSALRRLVDEMLSDTGGTRKFSSIRSKDDPRVPLLLAAMSDEKTPASQRMRAATILTAPENKGVQDKDRKSASENLVRLLPQVPDEAVRYNTAMTVMDHTNALFGGEQRNQAARALAELSAVGTTESAERAAIAIAKMEGGEAQAALGGLLHGLSNLAKESEKNKARIEKSLEVVEVLYEGTDRGPAAQAHLLTASQLADACLGKDHQISNRLRDAIKTEASSDRWKPVNDANDPRFLLLINSLQGKDEQMKLLAAKSILSGEKQEEIHRWMALDVLTQLQSSGNKDARDAAQSLLNGLSASDAAVALKHLASEMPLRSRSENGPEYRKALNAVPVLCAKLKENPEAEANLYTLVPHILDLKDEKLTSYIRETLDRSVKDCKLSPIQSDKDARIKAMKDALSVNDTAIKLSAAIALSDTDAKGVDAQTKEAARRVVYWSLDSMIEDAQRLENNNERAKGRAAWRKIDDVLTRIGETEEHYGRTYVSMKRLELEGGKDKELLPLYERLARLSEEHGAPEAAKRYRSKAERARGGASEDTQTKELDEKIKALSQSATSAIRSNNPEEVARCGKELKDLVDSYTSAGPNTIQAANAMAFLGSVYAAQGRTKEAEEVSRAALKIYEGHADAPRQNRNRALANVAMAVYGQEGQAAEFKKVTTKLLAASNHFRGDSVPLEDGETLRDVVDYMLSKHAIGADAAKDAEAMLQRSLEVRRTHFGPGSLEETDGIEQMAALYISTNQPDKAVSSAQQAVAGYARVPGMGARTGDASAMLAQAHAMTGNYKAAQAAYEGGIMTMTNPGSGATPQQVLGHMQNYSQMLIHQGQLKKADEWRMQMSHYQQTGTLMPTASPAGPGISPGQPGDR